MYTLRGCFKKNTRGSNSFLKNSVSILIFVYDTNTTFCISSLTLLTQTNSSSGLSTIPCCRRKVRLDPSTMDAPSLHQHSHGGDYRNMVMAIYVGLIKNQLLQFQYNYLHYNVTSGFFFSFKHQREDSPEMSNMWNAMFEGLTITKQPNWLEQWKRVRLFSCNLDSISW